MKPIGHPLFANRRGHDLAAVLQATVHAALPTLVEQLSVNEFAQETDETLAAKIADKAASVRLDVQFEGSEPRVTPTKLDASPRLERLPTSRGGSTLVEGFRVTTTFPFTGPPNLWEMRPNPFNANPPLGEIKGQFLTIGLSIETAESEQAIKYMSDTVDAIKTYLRWQDVMIDRHNASLPEATLPLVRHRRRYLGSGIRLLERLKGNAPRS